MSFETMDDSHYRFHADPIVDGAPLSDDQAHHAIHVLRLKTGTPVVVFDGRGTVADATLTLTKRAATIQLTGAVQQIPRPPPGLTIATAQPRHDRAGWLVEQVSQLNVDRLIWLDCARSTVRVMAATEKLEKWRRLAIESAKQCHRAWALEIAPAQTLTALLATPGQKLWLDPRATSEPPVIPVGCPITALVGPEGGWTDDEAAMLRADRNVIPVRLGGNILRVETACAAIAARFLTAVPPLYFADGHPSAK
jgi:16S rRNA (uracil1498-N3)-methyltransferase